MKFRHFGAKNSWLTGTASWNFYAISQYILGVRPEFEGLRIDPVIPDTWDGYRVTRKFRGATYRIGVINPVHVSSGIKEIYLNEKEITGSLIPVCKEGSLNEVRVIMG